MELLIGLILAIVVLWLWLVGHWFGRILAFIAFAIGLGAGGAVMGLAFAPGATGAGIGGAGLGLALAWPLASWPIWHQKTRWDRAVRQALSPPPQVTAHQSSWQRYASTR